MAPALRGPTLKRPARIDPGDTAAPGADLGEVDNRHSDWMAGAVQPALQMTGAADLVFGGDGDLAIGNQARLCGGPAHVERDQVGKAELLAGECCGDNPGCRSRLDRHRRHPQTLGDVEDAPTGPHDVELRQPERCDFTLQPVKIAGAQRPDIGAHSRRAGALKLANLGQDLR